jgi:hypothetical protein
MKKAIITVLIVFAATLLLIGIANARTSSFQFPTGDPIFISFGGIPSGDIDLNGIYSLIFDADGDTYFRDGTDDKVQFVAGGAIVARVLNSGIDIHDNKWLNLGTGLDAGLTYNASVQTPDTVLFTVPATSRGIVIIEEGDQTTDFAHALQPDPTLFIQSAAADTDIADWLSLTHDQTDGVLDVGNGNIRLATGAGLDLDGNKLYFNVAGTSYLESTSTSTLDYYHDGAFMIEYVPAGPILNNDKSVLFGTGGLSSLGYLTNQTPDSLVLSLPTASRALVVTEVGDEATDFGHAQQTNPTVYVHSSDSGDPTQWISLAHNQTSGIIDVGAGAVQFLDDVHMDTNKVVFDSDADTYLYASSDDTLDLYAGNQHGIRYTGAWSIYQDNYYLRFGESSYSIMRFDTGQTVDTTIYGVDTTSRSFIFQELSDFGTNWGHSAQVNPTVWIHSSDQTDVADWGSLAHNQTDFVIDAGNGDIKLDDDVNITGALTIGAYTRHIDVSASAAQLGPSAPIATTIGTFRCLQFVNASAAVYIEFEVPGDWDGASDMTMNILWAAESGDTIADTETVIWDAEYRSVAQGEAYDNGTSTTISPTYTQSGAGTDKAFYVSTVTLDYDDANQPLAYGDEVGLRLDHDEVTSTYSGDPHFCEFELEYTSVRSKVH